MKKPANHPPVIVTTANITNQKMTAIVELSKAIASLSAALASTHVTVNIKDVSIESATTGIHIEGHS